MKYSLLFILCLMPASLMCMQEEEDQERNSFCGLVEAPIKYAARLRYKLKQLEENNIKKMVDDESEAERCIREEESRGECECFITRASGASLTCLLCGMAGGIGYVLGPCCIGCGYYTCRRYDQELAKLKKKDLLLSLTMDKDA